MIVAVAEKEHIGGKADGALVSNLSDMFTKVPMIPIAHTTAASSSNDFLHEMMLRP